MKFIFKRIPTSFDIFDRKRIIFKIQDPLRSSRIFSCMNVIDPILVNQLRDKFLNIWTFEAYNELE